MQPTLFQEPETIHSPICSYVKHCGHKCELGEPVDLGGCINTELRCVHCGARGVTSVRTDL